MAEWTKQWIPTPPKIWTAIVIVLCISSIYSFFQEYNDMQQIQLSIDSFSDQVDDLTSASNTPIPPSAPTARVIVLPKNVQAPPAPRMIIHHPHNPIHNPVIDFFNHLFKH